MKKTIYMQICGAGRHAVKHAVLLCTTAVWSLLAAGCIFEYPTDSLLVETLSGEGRTLALRVSMFDGIDDAPQEALPAAERMHELRVVITHLDSDGIEVPEYNRLIDIDGKNAKGQWKYGYLDDNLLMFLLDSVWLNTYGGKKHIYLFANSEKVFENQFACKGIKHLDPEQGLAGGKQEKLVFDPEVRRAYFEALKEATFTENDLQTFVKPDDAGRINGIPMSAEYDIDIDELESLTIANLYFFDCYIVRAANKITFTYRNKRYNGDIFVTKWSLKNTADATYLLPRVTDTKHGDWIRWYAEHCADKDAEHTVETEEGETEETKELEFTAVPTTTYNPFESEYTQINETAKPHEGDSYTESGVTGLKLPEIDLATGHITSVTDPKTYYFLESRYPVEAEKQAYTMSFTAKEYNASAAGGTRWIEVTYPSAGVSYLLDKVTTLFRNTHVNINATFDEKGQVDLQVSLINWELDPSPTEGTLEPEK